VSARGPTSLLQVETWGPSQDSASGKSSCATSLAAADPSYAGVGLGRTVDVSELDALGGLRDLVGGFGVEPERFMGEVPSIF